MIIDLDLKLRLLDTLHKFVGNYDDRHHSPHAHESSRRCSLAASALVKVVSLSLVEFKNYFPPIAFNSCHRAVDDSSFSDRSIRSFPQIFFCQAPLA